MARYSWCLLLVAALAASCGGDAPKAPEQSAAAVEATVGPGAAEKIEIVSTSGKKIGPQVVVEAQLKAKTAIELPGFWIAFKEPTGGEREVYVEGPIAAGGTFKAEFRMSSPNVPAQFRIVEIRENPKYLD